MSIRTALRGRALFVAQVLFDQVSRVEHVPTGDEKVSALETLDQPGGNAFMAALTCAKLGFKPDIVSGVGDDMVGHIIEHQVKERGVFWHPRLMNKTPRATILSNPKGRAIVSPPEAESETYSQEFPLLEIEGCRIVHIDGRQVDAATHYVREATGHRIPTSCDFGRPRKGIFEILPHITFPSLSRRYAMEVFGGVDTALEVLRGPGKAVIVTLGAEGLRYCESNGPIHHLSALKVPPDLLIDENGSGDIFNGARVYAYLTWPDRPLQHRLQFASAAAACKIQRFGNEPPTLEEVRQTLRRYGIALAA